jgi:hypothetical protein
MRGGAVVVYATTVAARRHRHFDWRVVRRGVRVALLLHPAPAAPHAAH